ncbi:hypothetical protein GQ42DRAFT_79692 [Ramicandelaber brevisporus]|nr:hypothetical protein GQ42DRAFT_79692 [Ramicandelaber brevisporus]
MSDTSDGGSDQSTTPSVTAAAAAAAAGTKRAFDDSNTCMGVNNDRVSRRSSLITLPAPIPSQRLSRPPLPPQTPSTSFHTSTLPRTPHAGLMVSPTTPYYNMANITAAALGCRSPTSTQVDSRTMQQVGESATAPIRSRHRRFQSWSAGQGALDDAALMTNSVDANSVHTSSDSNYQHCATTDTAAICSTYRMYRANSEMVRLPIPTTLRHQLQSHGDSNCASGGMATSGAESTSVTPSAIESTLHPANSAHPLTEPSPLSSSSESASTSTSASVSASTPPSSSTASSKRRPRSKLIHPDPTSGLNPLSCARHVAIAYMIRHKILMTSISPPSSIGATVTHPQARSTVASIRDGHSLHLRARSQPMISSVLPGSNIEANPPGIFTANSQQESLGSPHKLMRMSSSNIVSGGHERLLRSPSSGGGLVFGENSGNGIVTPTRGRPPGLRMPDLASLGGLVAAASAVLPSPLTRRVQAIDISSPSPTATASPHVQQAPAANRGRHRRFGSLCSIPSNSGHSISHRNNNCGAAVSAKDDTSLQFSTLRATTNSHSTQALSVLAGAALLISANDKAASSSSSDKN